ncbi:hypothetical protein AVEN_204589-1 [Araneus ventricosus]|uniref:Uncharacterized protein n=1 Tax=Araneus ventricosus TaxID=182803 RepID=A0A4Y2JUP6_ARAVE|nr:hypothetical protein AVEN_204589-1 [Araneus ventricosus]
MLASRSNYFHDETIVNHGKGANPSQTINHRLSAVNGGGGLEELRNTTLQVRKRFAGNDELRSGFEPMRTANFFVLAEKLTGIDSFESNQKTRPHVRISCS